MAAGIEAVPTGGHSDRVWRLSASADGKMIATDGGDETVRLWDPANGTERRRIPVTVSFMFFSGVQSLSGADTFWRSGLRGLERCWPDRWPVRGLLIFSDLKPLQWPDDDEVG